SDDGATPPGEDDPDVAEAIARADGGAPSEVGAPTEASTDATTDATDGSTQNGPPAASSSNAPETGPDPPVRDGRTQIADSDAGADAAPETADVPAEPSPYRGLLVTAAIIAGSGLAGALVLSAYMTWGAGGDADATSSTQTPAATGATADASPAGDTGGSDTSTGSPTGDGAETTSADTAGDTSAADTGSDSEPAPDRTAKAEREPSANDVPSETTGRQPAEDDQQPSGGGRQPRKAAAPAQDDQTGSETANTGSGTGGGSPSGSGSSGLGGEKAKKFRKEFETRGGKLVDKCKATVAGILKQSERMTKIAKMDKPEAEKEKLRKDAQQKLQTYRQRLQTLGNDYRKLLRKARESGVTPTRIRMMSGQWTSCYDQMSN
ncbi:MAG: hypothetical protein ABEN55_15135, partial [Bradymonadaceae bacterium]